MRLSTSTNICLNRPNGSKLSIEESMTRCAKAGFEVMDMNFYDCASFRFPFVGDDWQRWIYGIKDLAEKLGITFSQGHASFYNYCDPNVRNRAFWEMSVRRSVLCAEILEIPWLTFHAGTAFDAEDYRKVSFERNIEYLKPLLEFAQEHHVGIALENLWDLNIAPLKRYTANAQELIELIDACKLFAGESVGACWDFEHADIMGQDQRESLLLVGDRLKSTHVSDQTGINNDHILPYFGKVDWVEMVHLLDEINYKGDFTYECHRYTLNIPDELLDAALRYSVCVGNYIVSHSL